MHGICKSEIIKYEIINDGKNAFKCSPPPHDKTYVCVYMRRLACSFSKLYTSRKHAYIILTPLNPTFI